MRRRSVAWATALAVTGALACGCAHTPAPHGWLPNPERSTSDAFGGWLIARTGHGREAVQVSGELIAIEPDSVVVMQGGRPVAVAKTSITKATLAGYDLHASRLTSWAVLGAITTPTHGVFLLISLPTWCIAGGLTTSSAVRASTLEYPQKGWAELAMYARFPQGMPAGLDRSALRGKP